MAWLCGVDGFKDRWRAIIGNFDTGEVRHADLPLKDLLDLPEKPAVIAVDVPIGLPEVTLPGGRTCDRLARLLIRPRHRSVFSPIGRMCLHIDDRKEASQFSTDRGGIGISAQSWGLRKKLLEIDVVVIPDQQRVIHEVHPEVSFFEMNGGYPLVNSKKTEQGALERIKLLESCGYPGSFLTPLSSLRSGREDFLDACAALWTAERIYRGKAKRFPPAEAREHDGRGLDMAIWF
ncbi:MAG: DUF429 domain-containing protein [Acidobacteriota bacterium]